MALCVLTIGISYYLIKKRFHTKEAPERTLIDAKEISERSVARDIETGLRTSKIPNASSSSTAKSKEKEGTNSTQSQDDSSAQADDRNIEMGGVAGDSDSSDSESSSDSKLIQKDAERRLERIKSTVAVVSGKANVNDDVRIISSIEIAVPEDQGDSPLDKMNNVSALKKSKSMPETKQPGSVNMRRKRQNVNKSIKVASGQADLKKSMKHHRSKSLEMTSSDREEHVQSFTSCKEDANELKRSKTTVNDSYPDIRVTVNSDVRGGGRRNSRRRRGRSNSITLSTPSGTTDELKKSRRSGNSLRQSSRLEGGGDIRKSRRLSSDDLTKLSSRGSSSNLRRSSRLEGAGDLRKSKSPSTDDLTKLNSKDSSNNLRQSSFEDLRKSRRLSSEDVTKLSSRGSSSNLRRSSRLEGGGDLRKSRRQSQDSADDFRKSQKQDSYDLKRSRTRGSTENLRKSFREDNAGGLRKSTRRSADDVTGLRSSTKNVRKTPQRGSATDLR